MCQFILIKLVIWGEIAKSIFNDIWTKFNVSINLFSLLSKPLVTLNEANFIKSHITLEY
jgi:hypothetical protein